MHLAQLSLLISLYISAVVCQRYVEGNPVPLDPVPLKTNFEHRYDDKDYTEEKDINRWNVNNLPQPQEDYQFCNRIKPSYVCDPDRVLQKDEADKLDSFIQLLYNKTPCICDQCKSGDGGVVIGIAILKNMYQPYNQHPSKTIRTLAKDIRQKWKLGKCDNDILIVVGTTDRLSFTDVGKATSTYVSLEEAHKIFLVNKAHMYEGNFFEGLRAMLAEYYIHTRCTKMLAPPETQESTNVALITGVTVLAILLLGVVLFVALVTCRRRKRNAEDPKQIVDGSYNKREVISTERDKPAKVDLSALWDDSDDDDEPQDSSTVYQPCETDEKEDTFQNVTKAIVGEVTRGFSGTCELERRGFSGTSILGGRGFSGTSGLEGRGFNGISISGRRGFSGASSTFDSFSDLF